MPVISLECSHCGRSFSRWPSQVKSERVYCSGSCRAFGIWEGRDRRSGAYKYVRIPGHPLADKYGVVPEHRVLLFAHIGDGTHACHHCETPVSWSAGGRTARGVLVVDHLDEDKTNNQIENLVPSCHSCNVWRTRRIQDNEVYTEATNGHRRTAVELTCATCGAHFLKPETFVKSGEKRGRPVRYCSRDCMYGRNVNRQ